MACDSGGYHRAERLQKGEDQTVTHRALPWLKELLLEEPREEAFTESTDAPVRAATVWLSAGPEDHEALPGCSSKRELSNLLRPSSLLLRIQF